MIDHREEIASEIHNELSEGQYAAFTTVDVLMAIKLIESKIYECMRNGYGVRSKNRFIIYPDPGTMKVLKRLKREKDIMF